MFRAFSAIAAFAIAVPAFAQAAEPSYAIPAHVTIVDGSAVLERPDDDREPLERNVSLVEGDRVRTSSGRVEILFADGTLLYLDRDTVLDFQRDDFVRVMEGRVRVVVPRQVRHAMRIDTPSATIEIDPGGEYRVHVAPNGDAELAVLRGSGSVFNDHGDTELDAGERAVVAGARAPSQPYYVNAAALDDFDRWSDARRRTHTVAASARYLPNELHVYGSVFDTYGSWRTHPEYGQVWYPVHATEWQPYSYGRWHSYRRYGWTWIGRDPWAWPTHHFGRWGFSAGVWFWIPGRTWGPAWVAWAHSPGYVGWSPLGWDNRPIISITNINIYNRSSAGYPWCGWSFIREREFGRPWGPGHIYAGRGIGSIAHIGFTPSTVGAAPVSPRGGRAVPRNGTPSGTAVPRGSGTISGGGGLGSVPAARPRQIPTDVIRGGSPEPRSARPRERNTGETGGASAAPSTPSTPSTTSGRPARRRSSDEPSVQSSAPAEVPRATEPSRMTDSPRARERRIPDTRESSGGYGPPPAYSAPRERRVESSPRGAEERAYERPRAAERPASAPREEYRRPAPSREPRASAPRSPEPPASGGGGGERRAVPRGSAPSAPPAAPPSSSGQARRRSGG